MSRYPILGKHIDKMVLTLRAEKAWRVAYTVQYLAEETGYGTAMVYKWRSGEQRPHDSTLEILFRIGMETAKMDCRWADNLLSAAQHPDKSSLISYYCHESDAIEIPHNLPAIPEPFFGREENINELLELISPEIGRNTFVVTGVGGVGKTAMVLQVAHRCLGTSEYSSDENSIPRFDAIIFVSAKEVCVTPQGVTKHVPLNQPTMHEIADEICRTLDKSQHVPPESIVKHAYNLLRGQSVLLIIDNFETIKDISAVQGFLLRLPTGTKVIITTRHIGVTHEAPIYLSQLPRSEAFGLIESYGKDLGDLLLTEDLKNKLYEKCAGIPMAMIYAIGQMRLTNSLDIVLDDMADSDNDIAKYFFSRALEILTDNDPKNILILLAFSLFANHPTSRNILYVAGLKDEREIGKKGLRILTILSLIQPLRDDDERFEMNNLTRQYALALLNRKEHRDYAIEARERWIQRYVNISKEYGGLNGHKWHLQYDYLAKEWHNFQAVLRWCAATVTKFPSRYQHFVDVWWGLDDFARVHGYWASNISYLEWISDQAERLNDRANLIRAKSQRAYVYILMGKMDDLDVADQLLQECHQLADVNNLHDVRSLLAVHTARLSLRCGDLDETFAWLDRADTLNQNIVDEKRRIHQQASAQYVRGEASFKEGEFGNAQSIFNALRMQAQSQGWTRLENYVQNWLGDIAIEQEDYSYADTILQTGLAVATANRDRRRVALYTRSLSRLYLAQEEQELAEYHANEARDHFKWLDMRPEAEDMNVFIEEHFGKL